jgi:hypothetical protein
MTDTALAAASEPFTNFARPTHISVSETSKCLRNGSLIPKWHLGARHKETGKFMRKLTIREVIARSYPTWDLKMADRFLTWLDRNGYQIIEKPHAEASLVPAETDQKEPAAQLDHTH